MISVHWHLPCQRVPSHSRDWLWQIAALREALVVNCPEWVYRFSGLSLLAAAQQWLPKMTSLAPGFCILNFLKFQSLLYNASGRASVALKPGIHTSLGYLQTSTVCHIAVCNAIIQLLTMRLLACSATVTKAIQPGEVGTENHCHSLDPALWNDH